MGKTLNQWGRCQKDIESVMWWKVFEDESLVVDGLLFVCWNMKHERKIFFVCGVVWCCVMVVEKCWVESWVGTQSWVTWSWDVDLKDQRSKKKGLGLSWSWALGLVERSWTQSWVTCLGTWTSSGAVGLKVGSHEVGTSTSSGEVGTSTSEKGGQTLTKSQKTLTKTSKTLTVCLKTLTKRKLGFRV